MRLTAVDRRARALGLSPGLNLADARARVPDIRVHEKDGDADHTLLVDLADWCDRYTPVVAEEPPDGLLIEIAGSSHLFGGEKALLADVAARLGRIGIAHEAAIASTPECARAIARFGGGGIVAPGDERRAAAPLPVTAMELDAEQVLTLQRAGLKAMADIMERPRKPFAERFGSSFINRLAGMIGEDERPLTARRPVPDFIYEKHFAEPIGLSEDIEQAFVDLAGKLCAFLEERGRGGRVFEASFFRADGVTRRLRARSGRPLRNADALRKLFMMRLDALADPLDPGFGFDLIRLSALVEEPMAANQIHFERETAHADAVADLVGRLTARFGEAAVQRFIALDSHVPERAVKRIAAISGQAMTGDWHACPPGEPPLRPILLFTPPQPVETVAEVPDGPPLRFRWRRALHDIVRMEGPERITPEWWREGSETLSRDYYRVEDRLGYRFWLFRHGVYGRETDRSRWYIHGLFA